MDCCEVICGAAHVDLLPATLWLVRALVQQGHLFGGRLVRGEYVFLDREVKMCRHGFNHNWIFGSKELCTQLSDSVG